MSAPKKKPVRDDRYALIERIEQFGRDSAKSHDSLAFHLNQLTAQVTALQTRLAEMERPWWRRMFTK